jgi:predicted acetyltransferase
MFEFHNPSELIDGDLQLVLEEANPANPAKGFVPEYRFKMILADQEKKVGGINLRVGDTERLIKYSGHIGYGVELEHRGHHYAARSVRLLLPLARSHGLQTLWITCNPDNAASKRTCELAGAEFIEIVDVPEDTDIYRRGERQKCRYRLDL